MTYKIRTAKLPKQLYTKADFRRYYLTHLEYGYVQHAQEFLEQNRENLEENLSLFSDALTCLQEHCFGRFKYVGPLKYLGYFKRLEAERIALWNSYIRTHSHLALPLEQGLYKLMDQLRSPTIPYLLTALNPSPQVLYHIRERLVEGVTAAQNRTSCLPSGLSEYGNVLSTERILRFKLLELDNYMEKQQKTICVQTLDLPN